MFFYSGFVFMLLCFVESAPLNDELVTTEAPIPTERLLRSQKDVIEETTTLETENERNVREITEETTTMEPEIRILRSLSNETETTEPFSRKTRNVKGIPTELNESTKTALNGNGNEKGFERRVVRDVAGERIASRIARNVIVNIPGPPLIPIPEIPGLPEIPEIQISVDQSIPNPPV